MTPARRCCGELKPTPASLSGEGAIEELPHIAAWRDAYQAFGAKPQRTRNSLEALTRRAVDGLPRVDRLTDLYNAISVLHQIPVGGEDLDHYDGSPPHPCERPGSLRHHLERPDRHGAPGAGRSRLEG